MKVFIDMNLSPEWVAEFKKAGIQAAGALITIDPSRRRARILLLR